MIKRIYPRFPPKYIFKSGFIILTGGTTLFAAAELYSLNEKFYEEQVMPLIHRFVDPEKSHRWAVKMAKYGLLTNSARTLKEYPELRCNVFDIEFKNPIGLAAGFDKNGEAIEGLGETGLGFIEIGSVTPLPQYGNDKPRVFRIEEDKAVINRYGFNNDGGGLVSNRVKKAHKNLKLPLGVNLGKNKDTIDAEHDYEIGVNYLAQDCEYLVINVSSPNTPGLRSLQSRNALEKLMRTVKTAVKRAVPRSEDRPNVLLKITVDLSENEKRDIAKLCLDSESGIDGLIISNTTIQRPETLKCKESGGLSGEPLKKISTECIAEMYRLTQGRIPIIGCGGVSTGRDAYEKIRAGASLVQFYTALVYQGFPVIGRIKRELAECLRQDGFTSVQQAVGIDVKLNEAQKKHEKSRWWFW
ncbi:dihydroorotate dehydrogenase domain-containing protein [Ditylenchus destructor]|uniref:Dihydroorotate dehydrogenase (quinone), mitochondrial n=1 Tax=Ditylenchus destructor TaxID=166010 RepID=A0AAD4MTD2_9BILA|nr:dihydroorotate dehydrogenase domain-containing protein [Ditylenchus destructor]